MATKYQSNPHPIGNPRHRHARTQKVLLEGVQFFYGEDPNTFQGVSSSANFNGVSLAAELMAKH